MIKIETKVCKKCNEVKLLSEFYTQKRYSEEKGNWIYYRPDCKECTKQSTYTWREQEENREKYLASQRRKKPELAANRKASHIKYRESGKQLEWQRNNVEKVKEYNLYRSMNKKHEFTNEEWIKCKKFFNNCCAYCGLSEEEAKLQQNHNHQLHKEHVEHNGSNGIDNCIPACRSCNSQKWKFSFEDWYSQDNPIYDSNRRNRILEWLNKFAIA